MQRQRSLDQAGDAGGRLQVPEVGLGRAEQQWCAPVLSPQHRADGVGLDRVADRRAGAVRLDESDLGRRDAGARHDALDHRDLRIAARLGDGAGAAVLVDRRRLDHRVDAVTGCDRVVETAQQHDADALAAHEAIGGRVECANAARRRQHVRARECDEHAGIEQDVDAARQRHVARAVAQMPACGVDGHQRRRAGGVDAHAGARQVEPVRHTVCNDRQRRAGAGLDVAAALPIALQQAVIGVGDADENARVGASQCCYRQPRVARGFAGDLQQQALLGVHRFGLAWAEAEVGRVEAADIV